MESKGEKEKEWGKSLPYAVYHFSTSGGAVAVATAVTHPLDVLKVRLQMQLVGQSGPLVGMGEIFGKIVKVEGARGLYLGLAPALTRSVVYGGLRLGLYEPCKYLCDLMFGSTNIFVKIASGACSGALATALTNPMEVLKVRMQMNPGSGLTREMHKILSEDGIRALWKGVGPAMTRASALTASQLATYDESKQELFHSLFSLFQRQQHCIEARRQLIQICAALKLKLHSWNCWHPCNCTSGHDQDSTNAAERLWRCPKLQECISWRIPEVLQHLQD